MINHRPEFEKNRALTFASSLSFPDVPRFATRSTPLMMPPRRKLTVMDELSMFLRVLRIARKEKVMLLDSTLGRFHPDLLAAVIIGLWPKRNRPIIVMGGAMWEPNTGIRGGVERLVIRLADRAIHRYAVQSSEELTIFPTTWGVSPSKTRLCTYFFSLTREQGGLGSTVSRKRNHIFAGGNSHRDYEPLVEAANQMPEYEFVFATQRLESHPRLPPNVVAGAVPHHEFMDLMASAAAVIVPVQQGLHRAVGQQTYLNAMWLGKPTIVNDVLGVHDHIQNAETGFIVDGSPSSYIEALNWIFHPQNQEQVSRLCENAQKIVRDKFNVQNHGNQLLSIIDELIEEELHEKFTVQLSEKLP
jgi:glycosyltransferase involved in cell wall biosynthesis